MLEVDFSALFLFSFVVFKALLATTSVLGKARIGLAQVQTPGVCSFCIVCLMLRNLVSGAYTIMM